MPAQPNRSLTDGIALFGALCAAGAPIGSREAARLMGWEATRANRLLGTLKDLGLAEQDAQRRYRPGPGVHLLAAQVLRGSGLLPAVLAEVEPVRDGFGVALGVLWQGHVVYLLHAAAGEPVAAACSRMLCSPPSNRRSAWRGGRRRSGGQPHRPA